MNDIPSPLLVISSVARLLDYHQSRRDGNTTSPARPPLNPENAGLNLALALKTIKTLRDFELTRGDAYTSITELIKELSYQFPNLTEDDLVFCVRFLATAREICLDLPEDDGKIRQIKTSATTSLLDQPSGFLQVRLNENSRRFLRINEIRQMWLYEDKEAEKLIKAIELGQFDDVPHFCQSLNSSLSSLNRNLINVIEQPSLKERNQSFIENGEHYHKTIETAKEIITRAMHRLNDVTINDSFDRWAAERKSDLTIGNVLSELENIIELIEIISRKFVEFIRVTQDIKSVVSKSPQFLEIAHGLASSRDQKLLIKLQGFLKTILPEDCQIQSFSPVNFIDAINLDSLAPQKQKANALFELKKEQTSSEKFAHFIQKYCSKIIEKLKEGPLSFHTLVMEMDFQLDPDESIFDFFGIYTLACSLGQEHDIYVGYSGKDHRMDTDDYYFNYSDPVIFMREKDESN